MNFKILLSLIVIFISSCGGTSYNSRPVISSTPIETMETSCFHDGKKYSSGATLSIGGKKMKCGLGFWMDPSPKRNNTTNTSVLSALANRPLTSGNRSGLGVLAAASSTSSTSSNNQNNCMYSGKQYSSGSTLTIEGVKNTCFFGNWIEKNKMNSSKQIGGNPFD